MRQVRHICITAIVVALIVCTALIRLQGGYHVAEGWYFFTFPMTTITLIILIWRDVVDFYEWAHKKYADAQRRNERDIARQERTTF